MGKFRIIKTEVRPRRDGSIELLSYSQSPRGTKVVVNSLRRTDGDVKKAMAEVIDLYPTRASDTV